MNPFPFSQLLLAAIFGVAALATIGGAIAAVVATRLIRAVCGLMISCVGLAGLYYFLHSPFLALMEILIYVGAVCVTIVFAVMLAEPDEPAAANEPRAAKAWGALSVVIAALVAIGLGRLGIEGPWPAATVERLNDGSVAAIGKALLTTYSLAFELISLVLLVAILGALVISRGGRKAIDARELGILDATIKSAPAPTAAGATSATAVPHEVSQP